jgi:hypothetical protein
VVSESDLMSKLTALHQFYEELERSATRRSPEEQMSLLFFAVERQQWDTAGTVSERPLRALSWIQTVLAVEEFVLENQRIPVRNSRAARTDFNAVEQALADWLRYQRRPRTRDLHCEYQRLRLECIAGFEWNPVAAARSVRAAEFEEFVDVTGSLPRHRSSDLNERSLAAWSARQLQKRKSD